MTRRTLLTLVLLTAPAVAGAQNAAFHPGPVFPEMAPIATIDSDMPIPAGTILRHVYDSSAATPPGTRSRVHETAARFVNVHAEAGVPETAIKVAVVAHGPAIVDLLTPAAYAVRHPGKANASAAAVAALVARNVGFYVCGQSAAAQGIAKSDLLPGVKMSLSASSAHALLQMQGYTLNPF